MKLRIIILVTFLMSSSCLWTDKVRPNFVIILVDDQTPFELKAYNSETVLETPNIDDLAK